VKRHAGRVTLGILCGSLVGVIVTIFIVLASEGGGSNDGTGWAWLDVVCIENAVKELFYRCRMLTCSN
jgi:hypothetical protein